MSWNSNDEKLLCMMVLDDGVAQHLSVNAGPAFWRAFIVQNRTTGIVSAKLRYKYKDGNRNWYEIKPEQSDPQIVLEHLRCGLEDCNRMALKAFGIDATGAITCFYPPDDGGDPGKTIIWLEQQDLIEITRVEPNDSL